MSVEMNLCGKFISIKFSNIPKEKLSDNCLFCYFYLVTFLQHRKNNFKILISFIGIFSVILSCFIIDSIYHNQERNKWRWISLFRSCVVELTGGSMGAGFRVGARNGWGESTGRDACTTRFRIRQ